MKNKKRLQVQDALIKALNEDEKLKNISFSPIEFKKLTLKEKFEKVANKYIKKFSKKQGLKFGFWVSDEIGGVASFNEEYFFNLDEIRYDIDNDIEEGLIVKWQEDGTDYHMEEGNVGSISFKAYTLGLRFEHLHKKEEPKNTYSGELQKLMDMFKDTLVIDLERGKTHFKKDESKA